MKLRDLIDLFRDVEVAVVGHDDRLLFHIDRRGTLKLLAQGENVAAVGRYAAQVAAGDHALACAEQASHLRALQGSRGDY